MGMLHHIIMIASYSACAHICIMPQLFDYLRYSSSFKLQLNTIFYLFTLTYGYYLSQYKISMQPIPLRGWEKVLYYPRPTIGIHLPLCSVFLVNITTSLLSLTNSGRNLTLEQIAPIIGTDDAGGMLLYELLCEPIYELLSLLFSELPIAVCDSLYAGLVWYSFIYPAIR